MGGIMGVFGFAGTLGREFRGHGLTHHKPTSTSYQRNARRVGAGSVVLVYWRAVRRRHIASVNDVLDPNRYTMDQTLGRTVVEHFGGG